MGLFSEKGSRGFFAAPAFAGLFALGGARPFRPAVHQLRGPLLVAGYQGLEGAAMAVGLVEVPAVPRRLISPLLRAS
jgi:hypothetical protein